jgi:DNA-binding MarR family transcriptional regulator
MKEQRRKFDMLLGLLDDVMTGMGSLHGMPHDFGTGVNLYRAEIHMIAAIAENPYCNMTGFAEKIGVTKGAVSQTIGKLVRKGLVRKVNAPGNSRDVMLELTEQGWVGCRNHEAFHRYMYDLLKDHFGEETEHKIDVFIDVMNDLKGVMEVYQKAER